MPNNDAQLLREFAAGHSQHAFRTLVERYQDMVFSTARRRLGNDEAANDVAQNVFAALARKAPWLVTRASVGGWLYKSTLMEAARRQRDDLRRYKRERLYSEEMNIRGTNDHDEDAPQFTELMPVLDDAMSGLSASDREALVLRFFRGMSLRDTGVALGTTEEAARKRVSRAVDKLSTLFKRKGVTIPAAVLAVSILPKIGTSTAAPAAFAAKAASTASALPAPGLTAAFYMKVVALSKPAIAALCLTAAAIPITWQAARISELSRENTSLAGSLIARPSNTSPAPSATPVIELAATTTGAKDARPAAGKSEKKERHGPDWERLHEMERRFDRESRLYALADALTLDENQWNVISAALAKADEDRQALWENGRRAEGKPPADKSAESAIKEARESAIAAVLSPQQQAAYTDFLASEARDRHEIYANRQLSEVQRWLHLSAEQKDQLFTLFADQGAESDSDPGPWAWAQTLQEGRVEKFREILKAEQFRLFQDRIQTMGSFFKPPPQKPAAAK